MKNLRIAVSALVLPVSLLLLLGCIRTPPAAPPPATPGSASPAPVVAQTGFTPYRPDGPSGLPLPSSAAAVPRPAGKPGNLAVLDWAGFKGAMSYTFDDANSSQIVHFPELRALGARMTFYLITGKPEASDPLWALAAKQGHEIGNHSKTHAHAGTGPDLDDASAFIHDKIGTTAWTMAAPFGDGSYRALATSRFLFNRGVQPGYLRPNDDSDPFVLPCLILTENAPVTEFDEQVDGALRAGGWGVVLLHGFSGGTDGAYKPVRIGDFVTAVTHARAHDDLWIDSVINVGAYWVGQKLLATAAPATAGDQTTWSWTLPPHFPPGRYLRIKVDGGTPSQTGKPLAWDVHGYYEVALDAGSLSLAP